MPEETQTAEAQPETSDAPRTPDAEQAIEAAQAAASDVADELEVGDDPDPAEIDKLLQSATFGDAGGDEDATSGGGGGAGEKVSLPDFRQMLGEVEASGIDLLRDVELDVTIELGQSRMLIQDVLKLVEGSVVELDKLAGDPVDVFINKRLVARGEVLVLNDNFCVRVNEIVQVAAPEVA